ncbi:hypothetical protein ACLB2K_076778 [Fragaria x ananassa]
MADHEEKNLSNECKELLLSLPKERGWIAHHKYQYQGFWCPTADTFQAIVNFQKHFQARDSDIVVASLPKSGTTWLKALTFAGVNQHRFDIKNHPLLTSNSHNLVPFFELDLYANNQFPDFSSNFPEPRLFATHIPFPSLGTIKESNWQLSLDEAFDRYCQGIGGYGPFWDNILGLAKFIDCSFTEEEECNGVIEDIAKLCSFDTMKKLEINKTGTFVMNLEKKSLFRKAEVGDWVNYFTPEMEERMSKLIEEKFGGSGLTSNGFPSFQQNGTS